MPLADTIERMHVQVRVGGKKVLWSAKLMEETFDGALASERVVAYDQLLFETVPATFRDDAVRLASVTEVICLSLGPDLPGRVTFEITNFNHEEWETETLQ